MSQVGDGTAGKICLTALMDACNADYLHRLVRCRDVNQVLPKTLPNNVNYCMKQKYHLYDTSRDPAWSWIPAAKRLLTEEGYDFFCWMQIQSL